MGREGMNRVERSVNSYLRMVMDKKRRWMELETRSLLLCEFICDDLG